MVNAWYFHLQNCWSMHDFFHSWNCDIAHNFSFENLLVNNAFFIFYFFICQIIGECVIFFLFAQLLVNVWFFFHLLNCDTTHDFFICRILGHMHHFFITKNCWWWIHDFFFHLQNCWSMHDFILFSLWNCDIAQPVDNKKDILMYLSKLSYKDYWIFGTHPNPPIVSLAWMICVSLFSLSK